MKITLVTVGKTDEAWVRESLGVYVSRLKHYVNFAVVEIRQLKNSSALSRDQIRQKEGEMVLKAVKPADDVVLLDERGQEYSSAGWARVVGSKVAAGKDVVFVIGGAYGFSEAVYQRADSMLSLSKMTFPHQMVRTIFAEQLYRAFTIIKGEPYHHE